MSERSDYFDGWYRNIEASSRHQVLVSWTLRLPAGFGSTSLLPWDGIADVVAALEVGPGDTFADLGCGLGGYTAEIARRTAARGIGVDFSPYAVDRARIRANGAAEFRVGEHTGTGLADGSVTAVLSIDAMQFADPYEDALAECRRILTPGGRLVLTGWEVRDAAPEEMPERLRRDIGAALHEAGFSDVHVREMRAWQAAERQLWEEAAASEPGDDEAMQSLHNEGTRVLKWMSHCRRVLADARK